MVWHPLTTCRAVTTKSCCRHMKPVAVLPSPPHTLASTRTTDFLRVSNLCTVNCPCTAQASDTISAVTWMKRISLGLTCTADYSVTLPDVLDLPVFDWQLQSRDCCSRHRDS